MSVAAHPSKVRSVQAKESSNGGSKKNAGPPSGVQATGLGPSQEAAGLVEPGRAEIFPNIASHLAEAQPASISSNFATSARVKPGWAACGEALAYGKAPPVEFWFHFMMHEVGSLQPIKGKGWF